MKVYETIDSRKLKGVQGARPLLLGAVADEEGERKEASALPKYIGFCHYRRYFPALWITCPTSERLSRRMVP